MTKDPSTQDRLSLLMEAASYDPKTGSIIWVAVPDMQKFFSDPWTAKKRRLLFISTQLGKAAFRSRGGNGYLDGTFLGQKFYAHRVAWALHYGVWPKGQIDHINGNRQDNRIVNLRDVSKSTNMRNCARQARNSSGVVGVHWAKRDRCWTAYIKVDGKRLHLGSFKELRDAASARKAAERDLGFHPNHGRAAQLPKERRERFLRAVRGVLP